MKRGTRRTHRWIKYTSEKKQEKPRKAIKFKRSASATSTTNSEYFIFSFPILKWFLIFFHVSSFKKQTYRDFWQKLPSFPKTFLSNHRLREDFLSETWWNPWRSPSATTVALRCVWVKSRCVSKGRKDNKNTLRGYRKYWKSQCN